MGTLSSDIQAGDFYDYDTGELTPKDEKTYANVRIRRQSAAGILVRHFLYRQTDISLARCFLDIKKHMQNNADQSPFALSPLLPVDFVQSPDSFENHSEAQVTAFFRVIQRAEELDEKSLDSNFTHIVNMRQDQNTNYLIERVDYGVDVIFTMRRPIDMSCETKAQAEGRIYRSAKVYFDQAVKGRVVDDIATPFELKNLKCSANVVDWNRKVVGSFDACAKFFCKILSGVQSNIQDGEQWHPIEISIHQTEDVMTDRLLEDIKQHVMYCNNVFTWMSNEVDNISKLDRIAECLPLLHERLAGQFRQLIPRLKYSMNEDVKKLEIGAITDEMVDAWGRLESASELLMDMINWLIQLRVEIDEIFGVLHWKPTSLSDESNGVYKDSEARGVPVERKLDSLVHRANTCIAVESVSDPEHSETEPEENPVDHQQDRDNLNSFDTDSVIHLANTSITAVDSVSDPEYSESDQEENAVDHHQDRGNLKNFDSDIGFISKTNGRSTKEEELVWKNFRLPGRISDAFIDETYQYSKLLKRGQPNVYELNAIEKKITGGFLSYDVGLPPGAPSNFGLVDHKVIILMGATGCGKSTLINGMVNFILGVQWEDKHRFRIVREVEAGSGRSQAHSQTTTVTAYTIRHYHGMAVPYSLTLIDTPGYGDTRGLQMDKANTENIHRFLTEQESRIDQIHAVCFVATSGEARLTATQRYVLDSVLSIFGQDVKNNIRLLVTFADNADPPVVDACHAAHFPTSHSGDIAFSKFNSSVLYVSSVKMSAAEQDMCFDELFWNMGQENFDKFFRMLGGMKGCDLTSTRHIIGQRRQVQHLLRAVDFEIEVLLAQLENAETLRQKMEPYVSWKSVATKVLKDVIVDRTETLAEEVKCSDGSLATNCVVCRRTCVAPDQRATPMENGARCAICGCNGSGHELQPFEYVVRFTRTKMTLFDMKKNYEKDQAGGRVLTAEQLVDRSLKEAQNTKEKLFRLLEQVNQSAISLDSKALRSNGLTAADYLSLMRSRVAEEQAPGHLARLETLDELQRSL